MACYGIPWQRVPVDAPLRDQMSLRLVDGHPLSDMTTSFLDCCRLQWEKQGKKVWLLVWNNASWHSSKTVRSWMREHNEQIKTASKRGHVLPLFRPRQSPWLNAVEPKGVHGKRAVV